MSNETKRPLLLVISAPSGAGKSSLCGRLLERFPDMIYSISCTTRAPRGSERDGEQYHFLSDEEFKVRIANHEFLEHAQVHGRRYGTLKKTVRDALEKQQDVIMDIDVQGAEQIRQSCARLRDDDPLKQSLVDIFIAPPSMEQLRRRLCGRNTDSAEMIEQRMKNAEEEMRSQSAYKYIVVNDNFEKAAEELTQIILLEHQRKKN